MLNILMATAKHVTKPSASFRAGQHAVSNNGTLVKTPRTSKKSLLLQKENLTECYSKLFQNPEISQRLTGAWDYLSKKRTARLLVFYPVLCLLLSLLHHTFLCHLCESPQRQTDRQTRSPGKRIQSDLQNNFNRLKGNQMKPDRNHYDRPSKFGKPIELCYNRLYVHHWEPFVCQEIWEFSIDFKIRITQNNKMFF